MATREEMIADLAEADRLGNTALAGRIASAIRAQQATPDMSGQQTAPGATLSPTPAAAPIGTRLGTGTPQPRVDELGTMANFFKAALAGGVERPIQRIKQLAGSNVPDEEIKATEDIIKKNRIAAGLGSLATDFLPFAGAMKLAGAGTRMLPKVLQGTAEFATVPAVSAAQSALTEPVKSDESAWKKAGVAALTGKAGELGGRALFSPLTGMTKPTADAQQLLDVGVVPSVSAGTSGPVSSILSVGQGLAGLFNKGKQTGIDRVEKEIFEAGLPKTRVAGMTSPGTPSTNPEFFDKNMALLNGEIDKITGGKSFPILPNMWDTAARKGIANTVGLPQKEQGEIIGTIRDLIPQKGSLSSAEMKNAITRAREERDAYGASNTVTGQKMAKVWKSVLDDLEAARNSSLPKDDVAKIAAAEKAIHHTGIMQEAARSVAPGDKDVASKLIKTLQKSDITPNNMYLGGTGHFMDIAPAASRVLDAEKKGFMNQIASKLAYGTMGTAGLAGAAIPAPVVAGLVAPLVAAGAAGNTRTGAKFLMGQNDWQKKAADIMRTWGRPAFGSAGANERE